MAEHRPAVLPPVVPDECPPDVAALLRDGIETTGGANNVSATLAHHPGVFRRYMPFAGKLLAGGVLPVRDREVAILRTAWRCGSSYEWAHHVRIAREAGLEDELIEAVKISPASKGALSGRDLLIAVATDELLDDHRVSDRLREALEVEYEARELIELLLVVGNYAMLAGLLNTLHVELEPGMERWSPDC